MTYEMSLQMAARLAAIWNELAVPYWAWQEEGRGRTGRDLTWWLSNHPEPRSPFKATEQILGEVYPLDDLERERRILGKILRFPAKEVTAADIAAVFEAAAAKEREYALRAAAAEAENQAAQAAWIKDFNVETRRKSAEEQERLFPAPPTKGGGHRE